MREHEVKPATYQLVISVDARRSGEYDDGDKPALRRQIYQVVEPAFDKAGVRSTDIHLEDRGDGILATVRAKVPPSDLLGTWLVEVHELLRASNRRLARPLGLRVGMHVGPVREDSRGVSGRAVDLACRLADSAEARLVMESARADLLCAVSDLLYQDIVRPGGWGIDPAAYRSVAVATKEGGVTAWFLLPGRGRPQAPGGSSEGSETRRTGETHGTGGARAAEETAATGGTTRVGRDQHNHIRPVYTSPVHFGDNNTGPAPRRGEAGHE
jgi:hypothetical protein